MLHTKLSVHHEAHTTYHQILVSVVSTTCGSGQYGSNTALDAQAFEAHTEQ